MGVTSHCAGAAVVIVALVATAGCVTEPEGSILSGEYGGLEVGVVATDTAAHFEFTCAQGVTEPLRFDRAGVARGSGTYQTWLFRPVSLDVEARPEGFGRVELTIRIGDSPSWTRRVYRDTKPEFRDVVCLAALAQW